MNKETDRQTKAEMDRFTKVVVISLVSFLLVEALLPEQYRYVAFLYLVLLETILWVTGIVEKGLGGVETSARMLGTYIALSALILDTQGGKK